MVQAKLISAALVALAAAAAPAAANEWTALDLSAHLDDAEAHGNVEVIHSTAADAPGVAFSCVNGDLKASLSLRPQDMADVILDPAGRTRGRTIRLTVGERAYTSDRWAHKPSKGLLTSMRRTSAARIYNGVVRGDPITVKMSARQPITITAPAADDLFADFGAECGVGRNAPEDTEAS